MAIYGYTTNFRLPKITFDSRGWHTDYWSTLDQIDAVMATAGSEVPFVGTPTGTVDAIVLDFTPNITYVSGQRISFVAAGANSGAVTVNCDGLGAKALKSAGGAALTAGAITTGMYVQAIYNGTDFTIIFPAITAAADSTFSSGNSGVTTPTDVNDLIVENSDDVGISLNSPAGYTGTVNFGRPLSPSAGRVAYDHATDKLELSAGSVVGASLNGSSKFTLGTGGVVRAPGLSHCFVMQAYTASTNLPSTGTKLKFGTIRASNSDGAYNTGTGNYTAPVAGNYLVNWSVYVYAAAGSGNTTLRIDTTAPSTTYMSTDTQCLSTVDSALGNPTGLTAIVHLNAGDTLSVEYTGTTAVKWKGHFTVTLLMPD